MAPVALSAICDLLLTLLLFWSQGSFLFIFYFFSEFQGSYSLVRPGAVRGWKVSFMGRAKVCER